LGFEIENEINCSKPSDCPSHKAKKPEDAKKNAQKNQEDNSSLGKRNPTQTNNHHPANETQKRKLKIAFKPGKRIISKHDDLIQPNMLSEYLSIEEHEEVVISLLSPDSKCKPCSFAGRKLKNDGKIQTTKPVPVENKYPFKSFPLEYYSTIECGDLFQSQKFRKDIFKSLTNYFRGQAIHSVEHPSDDPTQTASSEQGKNNCGRDPRGSSCLCDSFMQPVSIFDETRSLITSVSEILNESYQSLPDAALFINHLIALSFSDPKKEFTEPEFTGDNKDKYSALLILMLYRMNFYDASTRDRMFEIKKRYGKLETPAEVLKKVLKKIFTMLGMKWLIRNALCEKCEVVQGGGVTKYQLKDNSKGQCFLSLYRFCEYRASLLKEPKEPP
jgi:hypothetical protein